MEEEQVKHRLENSPVLMVVHRSKVCEGLPCTIHNRSDHHMRSWAQYYRSDRGMMERICPHGIGHPDPDDPTEDRIHGCDGCCKPPAKGTSE